MTLAAGPITVSAYSEKTAAEWAKELGVPEESIVFPSGGIEHKDYYAILDAQKACNQITFLPDCTYYMDSDIDPGSGLKVLASGATIIMRPNTGVFFHDKDNNMPGYTNTVGVTIEGGIWIMNASSKPPITPSAIKFVHASDIMLKNMTVVSNYCSHIVEFIAVNNAIIEGCTLEMSNHYYPDPKNEAIQLDFASGGPNALRVYPDNTACSNITIKNNKIRFFRGIGTNVKAGTKEYPVRYYNITVSGNTITTTKGHGIYATNVENLTAENNIFYGSYPTPVIQTRKLTGNTISPLSIQKVTFKTVKNKAKKISGKKDQSGVLTVTVGDVKHTYIKKGIAYSIKVPPLRRGTAVVFEQLCGNGNIYITGTRVK